MTDKLYVYFDRDEQRKETGLTVSRIQNGKTVSIIKIELDEQAEILYKLLTDQMTKAEIKADKDEISR